MTEQQNNLGPVEQNENVIAGIVGAFLFSLAGALAYFLFYQIGRVAAVSGLIGVILAIKGYALFAKKESVKGIIIASVIALAVLALGWYACLAKDIFDAYREWFAAGEVDYAPTYGECLRAAPYFLEDPEIGRGYYTDLAIGLVFGLIGSIGTIVSSVKQVKARRVIPAEAVPASGEGSAASADNTPALRSAETSEKVFLFAKTKAFGHDVIYRRVGKTTEELVIDNAVYATCECKASIWKRPAPHEMRAVLDGHTYTVGVYRANYISVDNVELITSQRVN